MDVCTVSILIDGWESSLIYVLSFGGLQTIQLFLQIYYT